MSSFKTGSSNKKLQPGTVLIGENGLPVDTIATIAGSYQLVVNNTSPLLYASGVVTVPNSVDLLPVRYHKARYTGRLILETKDHAIYFIDRVSVVDATKSFNISFQIDNPTFPATIDLSPGWIIAEAEIVNRLATTSSAKIDSIEFRDMQFQIDLDGDPVTIIDKDGDELDINPDGSLPTDDVTNVEFPQVLNIQLPTANTQYTITLPKETKRFIFKVRNSSSKLVWSYSPLVSGAYITLERGSSYSEDKIKRETDLNIYVQVSNNSQILELLYWT